MHRCKYRTGSGIIEFIDRDGFERATRKATPYYVDEDTQYAVCPKCDNPIQLIGLYKSLANTPRPFGRHYPKSVNGLAEYNEEAYRFCPLANPQKPSPEARKKDAAGTPSVALELLEKEFDRVVYLLSRDTGILFSDNLLRKMLATYWKSGGYLYPWISVSNLPWMFGYMSNAKPLFGQKIRPDSELKSRIMEDVPEAAFDEDSRHVKGKKFCSLNFCFILHDPGKEERDETLVFRVWQDMGGGSPLNHRDIFEKTLVIDQQYFMNLIHLPVERSQRNQRHLNLSRVFFDEALNRRP